MASIQDYLRSKLDEFNRTITPIKTAVSNFDNSHQIQYNPNSFGGKVLSTISNPNSTPNRLSTQFLSGGATGNTFGIVSPTAPKPQNTVENIANKTGYLVGAFNPYSVGGRAIGAVGKIGSPIVRAVAPKATGIVAKVAPAVINEAAQVLGYAGASKVGNLAGVNDQTNQFSPMGLATNLGLGLGLRGAPQALAKGFNRAKTIHIPVEDKQAIYDLSVGLRNKKVDPQMANVMKQDLSVYIDRYLGKGWVEQNGFNVKKALKDLEAVADKQFVKAYPTIFGLNENTPKSVGQIMDETKTVGKTLTEGAGGKLRGFPETVLENQSVPQQVKSAVEAAPESYYKVLKNKTVVDRVSKAISADEAGALNYARTGTDTDANASAVLLIKKYLDEGKYDQASNLIKDVSPRFTSQGQQIQILSLFDRLSPTGAVKYAQKIADNAKVPLTPEKIKNITDKAKIVQDAVEGTDKINKTAELVQEIKNIVPPSLGQKISTIQAMAQLLNPVTAIRNVGGNTMFSGLENVSDVVGTGLDKVTSLITKQRSKVLPSLEAQGQGFKKGLKQGINDAIKGIDTSSNVQTQFDLPSTMTFQKGILNKLEKVMNIELRAPDRAAYTAAYEGSLNNQMRAAGVSQATEDMLKVAHADALYRTFQDNSKLAQTFGSIKKGLNAIGTEDRSFGLGDLIIKYPKTPANILSRGLDYSPVGFIKGLYETVRPLLTGEKFNQKAFVENISRSMVGTGLIAAGALLAKKGIITGRPEKDKDIAATQKAIGSGPFKINVDALKRFFLSGGQDQKTEQGDTLLTYDWAQPSAIPFTMGANYALGGKAKDQVTGFLESLDASVEGLTQQPLVQGVTRFASDVNQKGIASAVGNALAGTPASFTPTILSKVANTVDPMARETYDPNTLIQAKNQVVNKIPVLRSQLPEKLDVFGRPVQYGSDNVAKRVVQNFVSPTIITKADLNPAAQEVLNIFDKTGETSQAPRLADKKVKINGQNVTLTSQQYQDYQKYLGEKTNQLFTKLASSQQYQALDDQTKVKLLQGYLTDINSAAKVKLFGNKPENLSANVQAIVNGQTPTRFNVRTIKGKTRITKLKKPKTLKVKSSKKPKSVKIAKPRLKKLKLG